MTTPKLHQGLEDLPGRRRFLRNVPSAVKFVSGIALLLCAVGWIFAARADNALVPHAVASTSFLFSADKTVIYSANFEGGSVSKVDKKTGALLAETLLGKELRNVALNADETVLAATDQGSGMVYFLDAKALKFKTSRALGGRPSGVVFDARNDVFWVTETENGKLYSLGENGRVHMEIDVAETPRGLALMPDGRLFITHAMIGTVSIYDTTKTQPTLLKTIKLNVTHDPVATVSQGLPRVLDRIVLSPDLKQAWLPHHLWSFDHPFQFQSTVFPVLSVLWMEKGKEHEVVNRRKQILQQINIVESGNVQRIVSNPFDAVFSDDGTKVYATMAGSEDLVTFDLSRAPPITGDEGAAGTSGANASQIFALPGQNPRGLVIDGEAIFVQNAMSLDITSLSAGGGGPFSQMTVSKPSFATLVSKDPLKPQMRRGLRLFHLAKTSAFPKSPMAGRSWMSCSSCHLDGFNFINGYLFRDTTRDVSKDAVPGHFSLKGFVAGGFVADYIRMIRQTQGGMGFDTKFPAPDIDPDNPPTDVTSMMTDLHHYVTSDNNLPLLSTWLRGDGGSGSVDHTKWINPAVCGNCHTRVYNEWSGSMHRLMGQSDPYYSVLEDLAAKKIGEPFRAWCMGCHSPQALLSGAAKTTGMSRLFEQDAASLKAELKDYIYSVDEGTGCLLCHRTEKVELAGPVAGGNASLNLNLSDRLTYPGEDSTLPIVRWLADKAIRAEPEVHSESYSPAILKGPKFCSSCHEEFSPGVGAKIVSTYGEWENSSYNNTENPSASTTCLDCHMHSSIAEIGTPVPGYSTEGGPLKANYRSHNFVGAQYHLVGLRDPERRKMSINLLKRAAKLTVSEKLSSDGSKQLVVQVANVGAGHKLPTGVSDFRQLWLDVSVTDADGKDVLTSGKLDKGGHLDPKARIFRKVFGDASGHMVGLDFWEYRKLLEDTRIPPGGQRDEIFTLPKDAKYPLDVNVKLMFRTFPQAVTDEVRKRFPKMPAPDAVELHIVKTTLKGT